MHILREAIFILANIVFKAFSVFPVKQNRILLECDYGKGFYGNLLYIYQEILKENLDFEIIIPLNNLNVEHEFIKNNGTRIIKTKSLKHIFYLATSKYWITDNHYYYFLKPRKDTVFINTWHALGAFKRFGLDSANTKREVNRFKKEGKNIDYLLVSSSKIKQIYSNALNVNIENIISIGIPRTDVLFNKNYKLSIYNKMIKKYPQLEDKTILLYAPTFRDDEKSKFNLQLDLEMMRDKLGNEYIVLLRMHPIISDKLKLPENLSDFVLDVKNENINDLLLTSHILITDYSSIIFEYSILKKPIIFFAYDYEKYNNHIRGFYHEYKKFVPGPIVKNTVELINVITQKDYDLNRVEEFSNLYCEYKDGKSTKRFIDFLLKIAGKDESK